jgi:hypothetical protein
MSDERRLPSERVTEPAVRPRRTIGYFWWQHEREAQLRSAGVLVAHRAVNAGAEAARDLPAAG